MKYLLSILLTLTLTLSVYAKPLTLDEVLEATCRVEVNGALGSGTVIHKSNGKYYILTNAHVVGRNTNANLSFFNNGVKSNPMPARIVWRRSGQGVDFAIITINSNLFGDHPPRIIPLVPPNYTVSARQYITSAGCPRGAWAVAWEGHALSNANGRVLFQPPPVGGQSGSGVHVKWKNPKTGESYTRVAAVLTWRIGREGTDSRGYEIANGGAIPVSTLYNILQNRAYKTYKVPSNYYKVAFTGKYALGSDGKYYPESYKDDGVGTYVAVPPGRGVRIIRWGIICPPGGCPPNEPGPMEPNPQPEPSNPGEGGLPDFSQPSEDEPGILEELEGKIEKLKNERDNLVGEVEGMKDGIAGLRKQVDELLKNKEVDGNAITGLKAAIDTQRKTLNEFYDELEGKKQELSDALNELNQAKVDHVAVVDEKDKEVEEKENQTIWAGVGGTILSILSIFGTWWWNKKRKKVPSEDPSVTGGVPIPDSLINKDDSILKNIFDKLHALESPEKPKSIVEDVSPGYNGDYHSKLEGLLNNLEDRLYTPAHTYQTPGVQTTVVNVTPTTQVNGDTFEGENEAIRQWAELKTNDGENIKQWAVYAVLYREAVNRMKKGLLYFESNPDNRLQGQRDTANRIDDWVRDEFLKSVTQKRLMESQNIVHEAYIGFLYKEAVSRLRMGCFDVLGAEATANAIDLFVKKAFCRKMNITL